MTTSTTYNNYYFVLISLEMFIHSTHDWQFLSVCFRSRGPYTVLVMRRILTYLTVVQCHNVTTTYCRKYDCSILHNIFTIWYPPTCVTCWKIQLTSNANMGTSNCYKVMTVCLKIKFATQNRKMSLKNSCRHIICIYE